MKMEIQNASTTAMVTTTKKMKKTRQKRTRHPLFRGVRQRCNGKWVSEVRDPRTKMRIWLGTFITAEMAAVAHDAAILTLHGHGPSLNFPSFAEQLPLAASLSHRDIQRAARQASMEVMKLSSFTKILSKSCEDMKGDDKWEWEFVDQEAVFNMPALIDGMAAGMLLTPPAMKKGFSWSEVSDDDDCVDLTLW